MEVSGPRHLEFLGELGRGGFGSVYLANLRGNDRFVRRVAVKVMRPGLHVDPQLLARQRDEARLLGLLTHPAVVQVLDLATVDGRPAVVMEYVEGLDAGRILEHLAEIGERLPERAALEIVGAAASALDAVYTSLSPESGEPLCVIHRDVKPANLLITAHGTVKVLDFGVARAEFNREGVTGSVFFGTAPYMAPEFWLGEPIGPAYDVYALGVTLLELLTGVAPERVVADRGRHRAALGQRLTEVRGVQAETLALLTSMLAFDAADRPSARVVEEQAAVLAARSPTESLPRFTRRALPPLLSSRREGIERAAVAGDGGVGDATSGPRVGDTIQLGAAPDSLQAVPVTRPRRGWLAAGLVATALLSTGVAGVLWRVARPAEAVVTVPSAAGSPALPDGGGASADGAPTSDVAAVGAASGPPGGTTAGAGATAVDHVPQGSDAAGSTGSAPGPSGQAPSGQAPSGQAPSGISERAPSTSGPGSTGPGSTTPGSTTPSPGAPPSGAPSAGAQPSGAQPSGAQSAEVPGQAPAATVPAATSDDPSGGVAPTSGAATAVASRAPSGSGAATTRVDVSIGSDPMGAQVLVDGVSAGYTPLAAHLAPGSHVVTLVVGGQSVRRAVEIGDGHPNVFSYKAATDSWSVRVK